jgi:Cof subfamily protein (haloacid dehalogenase superfamily)
MMKYKAIISDIDGTLGPVTLMPLPTDEVRQKIISSIEKGFIFTLATGKPFSLVEYLIDYLHLTAPIIVDNGAALYDPKSRKQIIEYIIDTDEAKKILLLIQKTKNEYRVSCSNENFKNLKYLRQDQRVRKFIILDLTPEQADSFISTLEQEFKNLHIVKTSSDLGKQYNAVYISAANATKQHAVLKFAEIMGLSTKEIIGVGDHYNDFPLLMACGFKVAMGNAIPELKAIADYIAPSLEDNGLVDILDKYS